jgi:hypothetical protein
MRLRRLLALGSAFILIIVVVSACQRQNHVCPPEEGTPQPQPKLADLIALPPPPHQVQPKTVEIGGKPMEVDILVDYALCNDVWDGTVYVSCDAQFAAPESITEEGARFLEGCDLQIAPGTVVYVAAHNDAAYYKGCSCHTGVDPIP